MEVKEVVKVINVELTHKEALNLRNICADSKVTELYGYEFCKELCNKITTVTNLSNSC